MKVKNYGGYDMSSRKTLVFQGSPRKNGETAKLVFMLEKELRTQVEIINAYDLGVSPCVDCRRCKTVGGCSIDDGMTEIYRKIEQADNIVIASPIYFTEITAPLLSLFSRLQTYYCAKVMRNEQTLSAKKGGIILVGGGSGKPDKALDTSKIILRAMNVCGEIPSAVFFGTDYSEATANDELINELKKIAAYLDSD